MIKDTMMSPADVEAIMLPKNSYIMPVELGKCMDLIEAQAEITGKIMKQEGIREVVEWLKTKGAYLEDPITGNKSAPCALLVGLDEWQAKLKEWGV